MLGNKILLINIILSILSIFHKGCSQYYILVICLVNMLYTVYVESIQRSILEIIYQALDLQAEYADEFNNKEE